MSVDFEPDGAWLRQEWVERARDDIFAGAVSSDHPVVLIVGGQPGAGKTAGVVSAQQMYPDERFVPIIGDDYRSYHPQYEDLVDHDPIRMPNVTQTVSGPFVAMALDHAIDQGISVSLEGTFRDPQMVTATAARFKAAGFAVHAVVLAVPPAQSLLSTVDRYVGAIENGYPARWTPVTAHDAALAGIPTTVQELGAHHAVDRVTVVHRDGTIVADLDEPASKHRARQAAGAVATEQHRALTPDQAQTWSQRHTQLTDRFHAVPALRQIHHTDQVQATMAQLDNMRAQLLDTPAVSQVAYDRPGGHPETARDRQPGEDLDAAPTTRERSAPYDRTNESDLDAPGVTDDAREARQQSAAGFSRSTDDMLARHARGASDTSHAQPAKATLGRVAGTEHDLGR